MTDDQVLSRFDRNSHFREGRRGWSPENIEAFCRIARAAHAAGYDWFHVGIPERPVRFGRISAGGKRVEAAQGYLEMNGPWITNNDAPEALDFDLGDFLVITENADRFEAALHQYAAEIQSWQPTEPARAGYWPDEPHIDRSK